MSTRKTVLSGSPPTITETSGLIKLARVDELSVGVLHLGVKTVLLQQEGFQTIGDLALLTRAEILRIPAMGWRTADRLIENRLALFAASDAETGIDWEKYCETTGIALLPRLHRPGSGEEFLRCLPDFLNDVADNLDDELFSVILRERICQSPGRRKTLEQIASTTSPSVTREWIRQKESKLLRLLSGGLLNDNYGALDIHFRPEFSLWWKLASDYFAHLEEIDFSDFVNALSDLWGVPNDSVIAQLPIIVAIVTGEPQMSGEFRAASRVDSRLFGALNDELISLPLCRLRIGSYAARLAEQGSETVGDLIARLREGSIQSGDGKVADVAVQHINLLASCLCDDGSVDWLSYRKANALGCLPASPVLNAGEFVASVRPVVSELLAACSVTKRASEIYLLRTSRAPSSQLTLKSVADSLATHLPTVKREETTFLGFLNRVFMVHDFSNLPVWLDDSWLGYWDAARACYEAYSCDFGRFSENLASNWHLTETEVSGAMPTIWAVLSGYPTDRRSKKATRREAGEAAYFASVPKLLVGQVHLRGFRRVH